MVLRKQITYVSERQERLLMFNHVFGSIRLSIFGRSRLLPLTEKASVLGEGGTSNLATSLSHVAARVRFEALQHHKTSGTCKSPTKLLLTTVS
jgi:hypothetical protein